MRILGIDCGSERTGFGIVDSDGRTHTLVDHGVIRTSTKAPFEQRLQEIAQGLRRSVVAFAPEIAAVEEVFYAVNVKTAIKLSHVRGVALLVIAEARLDLAEYSPLTVKMSVVGYGRAEKHQVQKMVAALLRLPEAIQSQDTCDALAVAICHANQLSTRQRMAVLRLSILALLVQVVILSAQSITYSKSFPGSVPEWVEITVPESGDAVYKDDPKSELTVQFAVSEADRVMLRDLAAKLGKFSRPLESPAKVANMGMKTFRYEQGAERNEVKFNYSEDLDAQSLAGWYERVIETEMARLDLENAARFEKLGVEKALLRLEVLWDRKRLVAPEQLLPILDRVVRNESYLHMARSRAAGLAEHIRGTVK